jgi:hypothetical protein
VVCAVQPILFFDREEPRQDVHYQLRRWIYDQRSSLHRQRYRRRLDREEPSGRICHHCQFDNRCHLRRVSSLPAASYDGLLTSKVFATAWSVWLTKVSALKRQPRTSVSIFSSKQLHISSHHLFVPIQPHYMLKEPFPAVSLPSSSPLRELSSTSERWTPTTTPVASPILPSLSKPTGRLQWDLPMLVDPPRSRTDRLLSTPVSTAHCSARDAFADSVHIHSRNHPYLLKQRRRQGLLRWIPQLLSLKHIRLLWIRWVLRHSLQRFHAHLLECVSSS